MTSTRKIVDCRLMKEIFLINIFNYSGPNPQPLGYDIAYFHKRYFFSTYLQLKACSPSLLTNSHATEGGTGMTASDWQRREPSKLEMSPWTADSTRDGA